MENAGYTTLTRQAGLLRELQAVANNIANISTTGYRAEGLIFAEYVQPTGTGSSLSMASADVRHSNLQQGALTKTGGRFDLAIEGQGFFLIETSAGNRLTRAGSFTPNDAAELVTADGHRLLDGGGAPIFVPPDVADVQIAADGTISVEGQAVGQIGLFRPGSDIELARQAGTLFSFSGDLEPEPDSRILQGFLENSNVEPVWEVARMIELQRSYELGQSFLEREDERIRNVLRTLGQ